MCERDGRRETERERERGEAREQLHSEEEFCSADDYTCRADASPAAGTFTAKVTEPGWHRAGPRGHAGRECVCFCAGLDCGKMKQLFVNVNSKRTCVFYNERYPKNKRKTNVDAIDF